MDKLEYETIKTAVVKSLANMQEALLKMIDIASEEEKIKRYEFALNIINHQLSEIKDIFNIYEKKLSKEKPKFPTIVIKHKPLSREEELTACAKWHEMRLNACMMDMFNKILNR